MTNADRGLAQYLDPAQALYLLIEPMGGEPPMVADSIDAAQSGAAALQLRRRQAWAREVVPLALDAVIKLPVQLHPYLVVLQGVDDPWLAASAELASAEFDAGQRTVGESAGFSTCSIGGWLHTGRNPSTLAQNLASLMRLKVSAYTPLKYLRLADRRALALVRAVVGDQTLGAALAGVESWTYVNPLGHYTALRGTADDAPQPLTLSEEHWAAIRLGHRVHPALAQWLSLSPRQTRSDAIGPNDDAAAMRLAVLGAQAATRTASRWPRRFAGEADFIAWGVLHMLHPRFDERPEVAALLASDTAGTQSAQTLHALRPEIERLLQPSAVNP